MVQVAHAQQCSSELGHCTRLIATFESLHGLVNFLGALAVEEVDVICHEAVGIECAGVVDVSRDYMSLRRIPVALALMTSSKCGVWSAGIPRWWLTFLMIVLISSSVLVSGIPTILMTRTIVFP